MSIDPADVRAEMEQAQAFFRMSKAAAESGAVATLTKPEMTLHEFTRESWDIVEPTTPYIDNWHIGAVTEHLTAATYGEIRKLVINIPPGFMKSLLACVFWFAWTWTFRPSSRWLYTAYAETLATRDSVRCRNLIRSPWYQERWGNRFAMRGDQNLKTYYENDRTGYRIAAGVGGLGTGFRGDFVIVDDPHKVKEAESDVQREEVNRWWLETMSTRVNDPRSSVHVVIMQRLHDEDLTGTILEKELGYTHLCYDRETEVLTRGGWVRFDELTEGEAVAQVDTRSLAMSFVVPDAYTRYRYQGEMVRYKSDCVDLLVTPDHRMVYKDQNDFRVGDDRYNWRVRAAAALPGRFYLPQSVEWNAPDVERVMLGGEWLSGDDYVRFMGAWISEGCTRVRGDVVISQDKGDYADQIEELLKTLPFSFKRIAQGRKRPNHLHFLSYHRALVDDLQRYGKSGDKFVPEIIKEMSTRQIALFLQWYEWGDGHRYRKNPLKVQYVSKSRRMIDDVQELMLRLGKTGGVQTHPGCWRVQERVHKHQDGGGYKWYGKVRPENTSREAFDDEVFCVSVPHGALLVRRNGKPAVSGNCLPMHYDREHPYVHTPEKPTSIGFVDPRRAQDELLFPERMPESAVEEQAAALEVYGVAGQHEQLPVQRGGMFFQRQWFKIKKLEVLGINSVEFDFVRYWDKAATEGGGAFTVGLLMCRLKPLQTTLLQRRPFIILDVIRKQLSLYEREELIAQTAATDTAMYGNGVETYFEREGGSGGKDGALITIEYLAGYLVYADSPTGDKRTRAAPMAIQAEAGNVWLVEADWNKEFLDEYEKFDRGRFKDQVDAGSGATKVLALKGKPPRRRKSKIRSIFSGSGSTKR